MLRLSIFQESFISNSMHMYISSKKITLKKNRAAIVKRDRYSAVEEFMAVVINNQNVFIKNPSSKYTVSNPKFISETLKTSPTG